jgi:hexosaminidase
MNLFIKNFFSYLTCLKNWIIICLLLGSVIVVKAQDNSSKYRESNNLLVNEKPFVVPPVQEWKCGNGFYFVVDQTAIVLPRDNADRLRNIANTLSRDFEELLGQKLKVRVGKPKKGDIYLDFVEDEMINKEAYTLVVADYVSVKASHFQGLMWGTRTLLQVLDLSDGKQIAKGEAYDYPKYEKRGFMLDCGRKFFPLDFLKDYVKIMSYYKMNTFHIHLNDNGFKQFFNNNWDETYSAFRLESDTYPGLTAKDGFYTKKDFVELQLLAEEYGVTIIPEIDIPAHSLAFTHYMPEIASKEHGMDHLDLFNPKTYEFIDGLLNEYLEGENPVFRGPIIHIGTDEYSNEKIETVEKFRYFTDYYIRFVEKYGKQAAVWGALTHAKGNTPVKSENVIMQVWNNGFANPTDMIDMGYQLISIPDWMVYIVPAASYYFDYLDTKKLYDEWEPVKVGNVTFDEGTPNILGGMFAVWNDHVGNGISVKDVHHRVWPAMQTLSAKMWASKESLPDFEDFDTLRTGLTEAPGVNILGRIESDNDLVICYNDLKPGTLNNVEEIGYDYSVQFDIITGKNPLGTVLFSSAHASVFLKEEKSGKFGFSRDGYVYTFNYSIPDEEKTNLCIQGTNKSTKLFVNGKLVQSLDVISKSYNNGKDQMSFVQTLVYPLRKVGCFDGEIKNFKVYKRILNQQEIENTYNSIPTDNGH